MGKTNHGYLVFFVGAAQKSNKPLDVIIQIENESIETAKPFYDFNRGLVNVPMFHITQLLGM